MVAYTQHLSKLQRFSCAVHCNVLEVLLANLLHAVNRFTTFESAVACLVSLLLFVAYQRASSCYRWTRSREEDALAEPLLSEVTHPHAGKWAWQHLLCFLCALGLNSGL